MSTRSALAQFAPANPVTPRHRSSSASPLDAAIDRARRHLLGLQRPDGHWCGELEGDTILESEYILLMAFLGQEDDPNVAKAARYILTQQRPDGAWSNYPGGPVDLSVSVKAYLALKIAGYSVDHPDLAVARELIRQAGGPVGCNSFSKFFLALLGQFPYDNCASVPPEMMFLPRWSYVNIYAFSSWTRTIVVPLTIFSAHRPVRQLSESMGIRELFLDDPMTPRWHVPTPSSRWFSMDELLPRRRPGRQVLGTAWTTLDSGEGDRTGRPLDAGPFRRLRRRRRHLSADRLHDHLPQVPRLRRKAPEVPLGDEAARRSFPRGGRHAARPALLLAGVGHGPVAECPGDVEQRRRPRRDGRRRSLAGRSRGPAARRLEPLESRVAAGRLVLRVSQRLLSRHRRYRHGADGPGPPAPWDRAGLDESDLPATFRLDGPHAPGQHLAADARSIDWLLGMQNRDGGWAAFDRDINREILTKVPFADHNAMLDPSCPDITARVLEALGQFGYRPGNPHVDRALAFLERTQDPRGCWIGRWGVNYLYGTWQVLQGLEAIGFDRDHPMVRRAVAWLMDVQQISGGWGESCLSYDDPSTAGQGPTTASQTAWALLALIAAGEAESRRRRSGRAVPGRAATGERRLGRERIHRHRISESLLPTLSPLSSLLPADGAGPLSHHMRQHSQPTEAGDGSFIGDVNGFALPLRNIQCRGTR